jgi:hypothetical protein
MTRPTPSFFQNISALARQRRHRRLCASCQRRASPDPAHDHFTARRKNGRRARAASATTPGAQPDHTVRPARPHRWASATPAGPHARPPRRAHEMDRSLAAGSGSCCDRAGRTGETDPARPLSGLVVYEIRYTTVRAKPYADRPGDGRNGWHNWEWLMDSVMHSLWFWIAQPAPKRAHCAHIHIWSRARGKTGCQQAVGLVPDGIPRRRFLGSAEMKNFRLVQVADHQARVDHICASGMG